MLYFSPDGSATSILRQFGPEWTRDIVQSIDPLHKTLIQKESDNGATNTWLIVYYVDPEIKPSQPVNRLLPVSATGQLAIVCNRQTDTESTLR